MLSSTRIDPSRRTWPGALPWALACCRRDPDRPPSIGCADCETEQRKIEHIARHAGLHPAGARAAREDADAGSELARTERAQDKRMVADAGCATQRPGRDPLRKAEPDREPAERDGERVG